MPATKKKRAVRGRPRLTKAAQLKREARIITDLKAGKLSYRMIAEKHSVSLPTVNAKARKAGISRPRGRRPGTTMKAASAKTRIRTRRVARTTKTRTRRRTSTTTMPRTAGSRKFDEAFRAMVLRYYPKISLARFDKLAKIVSGTVR